MATAAHKKTAKQSKPTGLDENNGKYISNARELDEYMAYMWEQHVRAKKLAK